MPSRYRLVKGLSNVYATTLDTLKSCLSQYLQCGVAHCGIALAGHDQGLAYAGTVITIKRAAELTGVPEATLRVWERRYGVGAPQRSQGGYRLYDAATILALRDMRARVAAGWSPQQAAAHVKAQATEQRSGTQEASAEVRRLTGEFFDAVGRLDDGEMSRVLDEAFALGTFEFVVDEWLAPALQHMGEAWLTGEVDIAGEHFASHAIMRRLSAAFEAAGQTGHGSGVLVGAPAGSMHEIGSLAFATAARRRGLRVIYLGADVPPESWVAAAERHTAQAVVVSVPTSTDVATAQACVDALERVRPRVTTTVGGGHASAVTGAALVLQGGVGHSAQMLDALVS